MGQTSRQAKRAYQKRGGLAAPTEREQRQLARAAELAERAERIKQKDKTKKHNGKKRKLGEAAAEVRVTKFARSEPKIRLSPRQTRMHTFIGHGNIANTEQQNNEVCIEKELQSPRKIEERKKDGSTMEGKGFEGIDGEDRTRRPFSIDPSKTTLDFRFTSTQQDKQSAVQVQTGAPRSTSSPRGSHLTLRLSDTKVIEESPAVTAAASVLDDGVDLAFFMNNISTQELNDYGSSQPNAESKDSTTACVARGASQELAKSANGPSEPYQSTTPQSSPGPSEDSMDNTIASSPSIDRPNQLPRAEFWSTTGKLMIEEGAATTTESTVSRPMLGESFDYGDFPLSSQDYESFGV